MRMGTRSSPQLGVATQVSIRSIEEKSGIAFGNLAAVDPFASGNESVGGEAAFQLLALEQVRFLPAGLDFDRGGRKKKL